MTEYPSGADCEMCHEVDLAGTAATTRRDLAHRMGQFSRLVCRLPVVDVISGLGALRPGYLLVLPRQHVTSTGELPPAEFAQVWRTTWEMAERVERHFGRRVVVVEHGSSGSEHETGRACIVHAHIHLFPVSRGRDAATFAPRGSETVRTIEPLRRLAAQRRNYYYCSAERTAGHLLADPRVRSQHARRIWATDAGQPDAWDWAVFPGIDNCKITSNILRHDMFRESSVIDLQPDHVWETVAAYDWSAATYAAQTSDFPKGSTIPGEIEALAGATFGTVLDAGAGAGRDSQKFADLGREVIALDASRNLLRFAPDEVEKRVGDIRRTGLPSNSIGAIWCSAVLLHLDREDITRALHEFRRLLTRRGLLHLAVKAGTGQCTESFPGNPHRRHFFYYQDTDVVQLALSAGFDVKATWTEQEDDGGRRSVRWLKVLLSPRRR